MPRSTSPRPNISLFDVFLGSGRTIRSNRGPPGTHYSRESPYDKKADTSQGGSPSNSKPGSTGGGRGSGNGSGKSTPKGSGGDPGSNPSSKPNSKPASVKAGSGNNNAAAAKAAPERLVPESKDFTPEQDAQILSMKGDGKTWNEIANELGKYKRQVTKRFHEINTVGGGKPGKNDNDKAKDTKKIEDAKAGAEKKAEGKKQKPDEQSKKQEVDAAQAEQGLATAPQYILVQAAAVPEATPQVHHHNGHKSKKHRKHKSHDSSTQNHHRHRHHSHHHNPPPPSQAPTTAITIPSIISLPSLEEDETFSFGELQAISELLDKDMGHLWHRISASFFSISGRRISVEELRGKFEGLEE